MTKKDKKEEQEEIMENEGVMDHTSEKEDELKEKSPLEEMEAKYNEINDKYLRLYSDFDNYRKRTQKERIDLIKTASEEIVKAILPILDDFERAQKSVHDSNSLESLKEGVDLIQNKLINILKLQGLEPIISAIGNDFNLEHHEAITKIPAPSESMKGKIIDEVEKGYKLKDKVIRFTKVVVGE